MGYVGGHRDEKGVWIPGQFTCEKPCPTHHMCRVITDKLQFREPGQGPGYCHWTDHAPGLRDLSRTGRLIWIHARRKEMADVDQT